MVLDWSSALRRLAQVKCRLTVKVKSKLAAPRAPFSYLTRRAHAKIKAREAEASGALASEASTGHTGYNLSGICP